MSCEGEGAKEGRASGIELAPVYIDHSVSVSLKILYIYVCYIGSWLLGVVGPKMKEISRLAKARGRRWTSRERRRGTLIVCLGLRLSTRLPPATVALSMRFELEAVDALSLRTFMIFKVNFFPQELAQSSLTDEISLW